MNYKTWVLSGLVVVAAGALYVLPSYLQAPSATVGVVSGTLTVESVFSESFEVPAGTTALELLESANIKHAELQLQTREYEGLGVLVTSMGGRTNGESESYWQYSVNGVMPQVGAHAYAPTSGETIVWKFQGYEQ